MAFGKHFLALLCLGTLSLTQGFAAPTVEEIAVSRPVSMPENVKFLFEEYTQVERICFDMNADVYSPVFSEKLKDRMTNILASVINAKKRQIVLAEDLVSSLKNKNLDSADLDAFIRVGERLLEETELLKNNIPEIVKEVGPRIVLSLARVREIKDKMIRDSQLLDRIVSTLGLEQKISVENVDRWLLLSSEITQRSEEMNNMAQSWLFCHQNILPDLKIEFQPFATKRRYRHLVLMPSPKTLAGTTDSITVFADVYYRLSQAQEPMTQSKWWKSLVMVQKYVTSGNRKKLEEAWSDLLKELKKSERPILMNHLIDWALAADPIFNEKMYFIPSMKLRTLREQTYAQKVMVERMGPHITTLTRPEFERERTRMLNYYGEYLAYFMKVAQDTAPIISRLNQLAQTRNFLHTLSEKYLEK